ncbi:Arylsulfatase [Rubripirellula amarantea]|uniref:Arylsulfatase n=1 Tax=Rubripirellula amarantea TaxID=2527999 RepID=A0A5C5WK28_9BACT|nr:sulfatase-like hydrolase/transferase [Rubripirellula amarantea]TWT51136.1 Arylsulfatase [Rubripirellula amarantea]
MNIFQSVIAILLIAGTTANADETRPNILFVFADDQCYDTIGELGNPEVHTPNLDRLAREGTAFTNAYNMGSWTGAVCIASRTMMVTGRSVWNAKDAKLPNLARSRQSWPQLLHDVGYETYMAGKWHIGRMKTTDVFDHVAHERPGMPNQTNEGYDRPVEGQPDKWSPSDPKFAGYWKGGKHWSEVLADDATGFLEDAAKRDKPFFMYLAFNAPHDPRQSPQRFVDMYPQQEIKLPENFQVEYPFKQEMGCYQVPASKAAHNTGKPRLIFQRDEHLAPWPRTPYSVRVNRQEYYAIISHMDEQIGRILDALDRTGKRDSTYIVFTADHGLACGQHGLMGKQNMYEHSMKPPLIMVGPGIEPGQRRDAPVYLQDIMPTTLELAGAEKPEEVFFESLVPFFQDSNASSRHDAIYGCYAEDLQRMVRVDNWKLIVYPQAKVVRMYDLGHDPLEQNDLAKDPQHKNRVAELFQRLIQLQRDMNDDLDLASFFPDLT